MLLPSPEPEWSIYGQVLIDHILFKTCAPAPEIVSGRKQIFGGSRICSLFIHFILSILSIRFPGFCSALQIRY